MIKRILPILILSIFLLTGCNGFQQAGKQTPETNQSTTTHLGQLKVHFLDVGQADSILVQFPNGQNMLIDAGNNDDGSTVVNYLKKAGVRKIDYLVGTHPHEDHLGGLDTVIKNFDIANVYMPRVTHTTKTYGDVLKAVQAKGLKITPAKAGVEILKGDGLSAYIIAPHKDSYEELNNYSAVIKVSFGETSFLFTGDAENISESEMLASSVVIPKADVLKVGHHGSRSSTTSQFLKVVNPKFAVISVGAGNDYGHPHRETLQRLSGITTYRTDLQGSIVFTSDGKELQVTSEKSQAVTNQGTSSQVYVDANGRGLIKGNINTKGEKIYHIPGGAYYDNTNPELWFKTEEEARTAGFRPSSR